MPGKLQLQLAATYAVAASVRVVDLVHKAVGATGIRDEHRFQRYFRDIHTIEQHAYVSTARYESTGQYFLGAPIEWPFYGLWSDKALAGAAPLPTQGDSVYPLNCSQSQVDIERMSCAVLVTASRRRTRSALPELPDGLATFERPWRTSRPGAAFVGTALT